MNGPLRGDNPVSDRVLESLRTAFRNEFDQSLKEHNTSRQQVCDRLSTLRNLSAGSAKRFLSRLEKGQLGPRLMSDLETVCGFAISSLASFRAVSEASKQIMPAAAVSVPDGGLVAEISYNSLPLVSDECRAEILRCMKNAEKSLRYSRLCDSFRRPNGIPHTPFELEDEEFLDRIKRKKISFQRVEVFYSADVFWRALKLAYSYRDNEHYHTRYFLNRVPPSSNGHAITQTGMPIVNLRLYDDRILVLGGYHLKRSSSHDERALFIYGSNDILKFYVDYWEELWNSASSLLDFDFVNAEMVALSLPHMTTDRWQKIRRAVVADAPADEFATILSS